MPPSRAMRAAGLALMGALLVCAPAIAQPPGHPMPPIDFTEAPTITAQMIVDSFRPPLGAPPQLADRNQAAGYLRAAKDLLPVKWCIHPRLPQNEVDGEIVGYLAKLPPAARKEAVARHIGEALIAKFPCPTLKER